MCQMLREKGESVRNSEDVEGPWGLIVMRDSIIEEEKWTRMGRKVE